MAKRKTGVDPNAEAKALVEGGDQYQSAEGTDPMAPDPGPKMRWQVQAEEAEARARKAREEVAQEHLAKQKAALAFVKGESKAEAPQVEAPAEPSTPVLLPAMRADLPLAEPDGDCCAVCRFGAAEEKGDQIFIHCRRHPPISVLTNLQRDAKGVILASETFSFFPILQPGAWCGDFEEGEPGIILPGLATKAQ